MAQPIKSPNSARPSAVAKPVPGEDDAELNEAFLASFNAPEAVAASVSEDDTAFADSIAPPEPEFESDPSFTEAQGQQFEKLGDRVRAGLAANDTEKLNFLKQRYGDENATLKDGEIWYRKEGKGKFRRFDPDAVELVADFLDFSREATQEAALAVPEIAGGVLGNAYAPGVGAVGGALAARTAFTPAANQFADDLASLAGIPRDSSRDKATEDAIQAGSELLGPVVGKSFRFLKRFAKGTQEHAERMAQKAAQKAEYSLSDESAQILNDVRELESGLFAKELGGAPLMNPAQINPDNALAVTAAMKVRNSPQMQKFQQDRGQMILSSVKENLSMLAPKAGHGPVPDEKLGQIITDAASDLKKAEGVAIGQFKSRARATLKGQRVSMSDALTEKVNFLVSELASGRPGALGITDPNEMKAFSSAIEELAKRHGGKGLRLDDIDEVIDVVGDMVPRARKTGGRISQRWQGLSSELRQFRRDAIKSGLPDDVDKKAFDQVMDSFSAHAEGIQNVADSINTTMGANAVVRSMFSKGKEATGDLQALRSVLKKQHPEAWDRLRSEWVENLTNEFFDETGKKNYAGLMKRLNDPSNKELNAIMFEGQSLEPIKQLMRVGQRFEQTKMRAGPLGEDEIKKTFGEVARVAAGSTYLKVGAVARLLGMESEKSLLRDVLTKEGVEQYLTRVPPPQRAKAAEFFNNLKDYARFKAARVGIRAGVQNPAAEE